MNASPQIVQEVEKFYSDLSTLFSEKKSQDLFNALHENFVGFPVDGGKGGRDDWIAVVRQELSDYDFPDVNFSPLKISCEDDVVIAYVSKRLVSKYANARRYDTVKLTREKLIQVDGEWKILEIDNIQSDVTINNHPVGIKEQRTAQALMQGCTNGHP